MPREIIIIFHLIKARKKPHSPSQVESTLKWFKCLLRDRDRDSDDRHRHRKGIEKGIVMIEIGIVMIEKGIEIGIEKGIAMIEIGIEMV